MLHSRREKEKYTEIFVTSICIFPVSVLPANSTHPYGYIEYITVNNTFKIFIK